MMRIVLDNTDNIARASTPPGSPSQQGHRKVAAILDPTHGQGLYQPRRGSKDRDRDVSIERTSTHSTHSAHTAHSHGHNAHTAQGLASGSSRHRESAKHTSARHTLPKSLLHGV
jgi:hypothetical protein